MSQNFIAFLSTPVYAFLIGLELYFSHIYNLKIYDKKESQNTLFLGVLGIAFDLAMKSACFTVLDSVQTNFGLLTWTNPLALWAGVFVMQDFCFYWLHRTEHQVRLFWAVHVNHHSASKYNFSVALRSSAIQPIYRYLFFIPCALAGFSGEQIMLIYTVNQIYQFFLHTEMVDKYYPWIEYFFVTPSHHRVHHAMNDQYIDKNMGQVLIIWDRMFGTFAEEQEKPIYGITKPMESTKPMYVWLHEFRQMSKDYKTQQVPLKKFFKFIFSKPGSQI